MRSDEILIRSLSPEDFIALAAFRCSAGMPWENAVEEQVRGSLPLRYLVSPPRFDGRMLIGTDPERGILVVGAHHLEPTFEPDIGYTEVVAVASNVQGDRICLPDGREVSLGELMLLAVFKQMLALGRPPRTFVRVDRRNRRGLTLCDRIGLLEERPDAQPDLVQRWGEMPGAI